MHAHLPRNRFVTLLSAISISLFSAHALAEKSVASKTHSLEHILANQSDEHKARHEFRNPQKTLEFFDIKPGMTVVEVLPGNSGWYSKVLLPLLEDEGTLIGADYPLALWNHFSFMTPERLEGKKTWVTSWIQTAQEWRTDNSAQLNAFQFANAPKSLNEKADAVLFIRALHNLNRFNDKGGYLDDSLKDTFNVLKPGGIVGIVQHQAREDRPDSWADGNNGYLKKSFVMKKMAEHGFEFVASSDINANPKDQAGEGDNVWRLLPSLRSKDPEVKKAMKAIGESNRMTLLFKKPLADK